MKMRQKENRTRPCSLDWNWVVPFLKLWHRPSTGIKWSSHLDVGVACLCTLCLHTTKIMCACLTLNVCVNLTKKCQNSGSLALDHLSKWIHQTGVAPTLIIPAARNANTFATEASIEDGSCHFWVVAHFVNDGRSECFVNFITLAGGRKFASHFCMWTHWNEEGSCLRCWFAQFCVLCDVSECRVEEEGEVHAVFLVLCVNCCQKNFNCQLCNNILWHMHNCCTQQKTTFEGQQWTCHWKFDCKKRKIFTAVKLHSAKKFTQHCGKWVVNSWRRFLNIGMSMRSAQFQACGCMLQIGLWNIVKGERTTHSAFVFQCWKRKETADWPDFVSKQETGKCINVTQRTWDKDTNADWQNGHGCTWFSWRKWKPNLWTKKMNVCCKWKCKCKWFVWVVLFCDNFEVHFDVDGAWKTFWKTKVFTYFFLVPPTMTAAHHDDAWCALNEWISCVKKTLPEVRMSKFDSTRKALLDHDAVVTQESVILNEHTDCLITTLSKSWTHWWGDQAPRIICSKIQHSKRKKETHNGFICSGLSHWKRRRKRKNMWQLRKKEKYSVMKMNNKSSRMTILKELEGQNVRFSQT